jgi:UDP-N-acetylglucosamine 2-epimerase (non-hydrolysing)
MRQLQDHQPKARPEKIKALFVFGTRPESVKLCPVVHYLQSFPNEFEVRVCVTAQHREMLDQVLKAFNVVPEHDLNLMRPGQSLLLSTSRIIAGLESVLEDETPDIILVQGDTTTTFCGALAGFYSHVAVAHVEAGLRTGDLQQPFPEEMNRVLTSRLCTLHFAPTISAAQHLLAEGVDPAQVHVTGNTGIDALFYVRGGLQSGLLQGGAWPWLDATKKLIVVTAHRRESFGEGIERVCAALKRLASRPDVQIVYPVHSNPNIRGPVYRNLGDIKNICLLNPLDYVPFIDLMRRAYLLLTDSGGVQEEGPSLGKPVLVMREKTERPEAVEAGTTLLVGTDENEIVTQVSRLLDQEDAYRRMTTVHNPYGDGHASERIAEAIRAFHRSRRPGSP